MLVVSTLSDFFCHYLHKNGKFCWQMEIRNHSHISKDIRCVILVNILFANRKKIKYVTEMITNGHGDLTRLHSYSTSLYIGWQNWFCITGEDWKQHINHCCLYLHAPRWCVVYSLSLYPNTFKSALDTFTLALSSSNYGTVRLIDLIELIDSRFKQSDVQYFSSNDTRLHLLAKLHPCTLCVHGQSP